MAHYYSATGLTFLALLAAFGSGGTTAHALDLDRLEWALVSDADLAAQRGGLISRDGLELSFGIEQLTMVNGELMQHRVLRDACDCGTGPPDPTGMLLRTDPAGTVMQQFGSSGWVMVVQNGMDDHQISHFTILNLGIAGMGTLDTAAMQRMIDLGIVESLTGP